MIRLGANPSPACDRSLRTLRRIGGALAYCGKQRLGLADQLPATRFVEHLIAEGRSIEHAPHLPGDRVALRRPPKELVGQRDIYRVVRGIAALERERGDRQRVMAKLPEGRIDLLVQRREGEKRVGVAAQPDRLGVLAD